MKKILFRADANPSIGIGDLMSFINLSKYFQKDGWQVHFITRSYKAGLELLKKYRPGKVMVLDAGILMPEETNKINKYIRENNIDVFFIQISERKLNEYGGIKGAALKACVSFDTDIPPNMDFVLNWDVGAGKFFDISQYPKAKFILGPKYAILPINFDADRVKSRIYSTTSEILLIAMGGADELNFTQKIVELMIKNNVTLKLKIIIGAGYQYRKRLTGVLNNSALNYELKQNITNMFEEYMQCDLAVAAGGLTMFELIASGTPALIIATYEHQIPRCVYFSKKMFVRYLGFRNFDEKSLIEGINNPPPAPKRVTFDTHKIVKKINSML